MKLSLTLINRDYTRLWFGQAVSSVGDAVFSTTLVLWVATVLGRGRSWAPEAVSGVVLAAGLAIMTVGPMAGVFVDRWDKRATMLRTEAFRGGLVAVLTLIAFLPTHALPVGVWLALIYVAVLLLDSAGQFFSPARFATIGDLVIGDADRARAAGIAQATAETAWIIGPPLAAPLLFTVGLQWALLADALSYLVSYLAIRSVEARPSSAPAKAAKERPNALREFRAGLEFFRRSRLLVALLGLAVIGQFGLGALETLNVFFTTRNLHASAHLYGYLGMAMGVGGITGALCAGRVVQWIGARRTTWIGLIVSGTLLVVYSRQSVMSAGIALLFAFAIPLTMLNTAMSPLLLAAAHSEYRGRVVAVFYPVTQLASLVAAALAGWLAGTLLRGFAVTIGGIRFAPVDTIFAASGLIIILSGVYARFALPDTQKEPSPVPSTVAA
ncbi:MAG TPA: MFS transporter [Actinospica sp.]|nr:MFS transporter [Actinospica sp.]